MRRRFHVRAGMAIGSRQSGCRVVSGRNRMSAQHLNVCTDIRQLAADHLFHWFTLGAFADCKDAISIGDEQGIVGDHGSGID